MSNAVRVLKLLSKENQLKLFWLALARTMTNFLDLIALVGVGLIAQALSSPQNGEVEFLGFSANFGEFRTEQIAVGTVIVALLFMTKSLLSAILLRLTHLTFYKSESKLASEIIQHIFRPNLAFQKRTSRGEIQQAITVSAYHAFHGIPASLVAIAGEATLLISMVFLFFILDPLIALAAILLFGATGGLLQITLAKRLTETSGLMTEASIGVTNAIKEFSGMFREIHSFGLSKEFMERILRDRVRVARATAGQIFLLSLPRWVAEISLMGGLLLFLAYQSANGSLNSALGISAVFLIGGLRLVSTLVPFQNALGALRSSSTQAQLAADYLELSRKKVGQSAPIALEKSSAAASVAPQTGFRLEFRGVSFEYKDGQRTTLTDLNFDIQPNRVLALVGPSGAGKTTIADLALGLLQPSSGQVSIDGLPAHELASRASSRLAYVPQAPGLIRGTVEQNITMEGNAEDIDFARLQLVAESTGLTGLLTDQLFRAGNEVTGEKDKISGGQKQRIGLARALYRTPRLVVLDEPTNAQDVENEALLVAAISQIRKSATVLLIAHRLRTIRCADEIVLLENGRIQDRGNIKELSSRNSFFASIE